MITFGLDAGIHFARGLQAALTDEPRGKPDPALDSAQRAAVVAMVCGPAPEGRARWTVRLMAEYAVRRGITPKIGRETIRVVLATHDLEPWREKMWCVPHLDQDVVAILGRLLKSRKATSSGIVLVVFVPTVEHSGRERARRSPRIHAPVADPAQLARMGLRGDGIVCRRVGLPVCSTSRRARAPARADGVDILRP